MNTRRSLSAKVSLATDAADRCNDDELFRAGAGLEAMAKFQSSLFNWQSGVGK